ncbi:MAG: hypothetical protein IJM76_02880 [Lachnospiraceae bacterium]|nr:hypothetical protein [Lachnospiraceae bacterium]
MKGTWKKAFAVLSVLLLLMAAACGKPADGSSEDTAGSSGKEKERTTEAPQAPREITVDGSAGYTANGGIFQGWGTSMCWWANRIGYDDTLAEIAAKAFCDTEEGLGLNIFRYNIGGGDDPTHDHITRTDSVMPGYWADPVVDDAGAPLSWDYDWDKDANQRNVLQKIVAASGDDLIVEAFSNSPPYFMTVSGCSSGGELPNRNNLREDAVDAFADYLADVAEHFDSAWGVRFESISPMNEPDTRYWSAYSDKQEGCHVDPGEAQSEILTALRKALDERGLEDVILSGTDETSIDKQINSLKKLTPEALEAIGRVDTHTYGGSMRTELRDAAAAAGKNLWMSEVDGGDVIGSGEMGAALWLAKRITDDLNGLNPSAWILWQVIDSHISSVGMNNHKDGGMVNTSSGYWGTTVMDHDKKELVLTMKYYAFGQFTRYIRPGSRLLQSEENIVSAVSPDGKELVIVMVNEEAREKPVHAAFKELNVAAGQDVRVIRTSGDIASGEHWKELEPVKSEENGLSTVLAPSSVTTFILPLADGQ